MESFEAFPFILLCAGCMILLGIATHFSSSTSLNIKAKTVGDGQHGTARWATQKEIDGTFKHILFTPELWRQGKNLPPNDAQGIIIGSVTAGKKTTAQIDCGDVHCMMIAAAGAGKTATFLYPNIEYALASKMSFICTDTKGDIYRNYGGIAKEYYDFNVAVIDLRNPTRSDGSNMIDLVNRYMDASKRDPDNLSLKAKAEKYAKITSKTIIQAGGSGDHGQNAYFYDSAEGILTATILLIAEFCPPAKRHIISVFKIIQDLLAPSKVKGKNQFQVLLDQLPPTHKAKWFAGAALNTVDTEIGRVRQNSASIGFVTANGEPHNRPPVC